MSAQGKACMRRIVNDLWHVQEDTQHCVALFARLAARNQDNDLLTPMLDLRDGINDLSACAAALRIQIGTMPSDVDGDEEDG